MAWNQPGQKNPWGRRPGSGGDLDAKVRNWQRKVEALLRRIGPGGGGSLLLIAVLVVAGLWLASGFFQIDAAQKGIVQRFGRLVGVRGEGWGWHWPWPIATLTKINTASVNSSEYKSRVLTSDVNMVQLSFAVQYRYADALKVLFQVRDPKSTLREVSESAIRQVVGQSTLEDVLVGKTRPEVTQRTRQLIQKTLNAYDTGIQVTSVNLTNVQVPDAVVPSQRDANKALADRDRFVKEAQAYANGIIPVAKGQAARIQQDAQAYKARVIATAQGETARFDELEAAYRKAPKVTRERLYLQTMEQVLGNAHKVLIDAKPGNAHGNMFYLPLGKLLQQANGASTPPGQESSSEQPSAQTPQSPSESVTVEGRSRAGR